MIAQANWNAYVKKASCSNAIVKEKKDRKCCGYVKHMEMFESETLK